MSPRTPSTYLTANELHQIAAIKFNEAPSAMPVQNSKSSECLRKNLKILPMKRYLGSKELEPPKWKSGTVRCLRPLNNTSQVKGSSHGLEPC
jgi:hypothetical protein